MPLDSKEQLEELIKSLQLSIQFGWESNESSPVVPLLEAGIDLFLILSKILEKGQKDLKTNPELRFSTKDVDVLNNPKQFRISKVPKWYWDPAIASIMKQLASFLVLVKNQDPRAKPFMGFLGEKWILTTSDISKSEKSKEAQKKREDKQKSDSYYRRQRRRGYSKHRSNKGDENGDQSHHLT
jgi:hypothetical protein